MKNSHILHCICIFCISLFLISSCKTDKHTITAKINGLANDTVFVEYMTFSQRMERGSKPTMDTIITKNGEFVYDIDTNDNIMMILEPRNLMIFRENGRKFQSETRMLYLMLKPGEHLNIQGKIENNYLDYSVTGSEYNKAQAEQRKMNKEFEIKSDSIEMLIDYYANNKQANSDSIINTLYNERNDLSAEIRANKLSYIKSNTNTDLAALYLTNQPLDTFGVYLD